MERAAEPGLGVCDDRCEPIDVVVPFHVLFLVFAAQRVVNSAYDVRHAVRGIETQVRVHLARVVPVRRDLPAAQVDRPESRTDLLDRVVPSQCSEGGDEPVQIQETPETLGAPFRQGVANADGTPKAFHVLDAVRSDDSGPTWVGLPFLVLVRSVPLHATV